MSDIVSLALGNLLTPMTLFFVLGFGAGLLRSDLQIPDQIGKGLSLYLMLAIGFKGGAAMAANTLTTTMLATVVVGVALSFLLPFLAFALLRAATRLDRVTAAAVSAHYGSVSVVTFVTAVAFLGLQKIPYETYIVAVVALMETPAIVSGLLLAARGGEARPRSGVVNAVLLREILLNGSVVVLVGSFVIGWITGQGGLDKIAPFIIQPFSGVLCLFLLDMGLVASRRLLESRAVGPREVGFALVMPPIGATLALVAGRLIGLDLGTGTLLAVLAASASYIAVPAAMRLALPKANAAVYITLSLAITFPFNVLIGIPLYFAAARWLGMP